MLKLIKPEKPTVILSGTVEKIIPENGMMPERLRFQLKMLNTFTERFASKILYKMRMAKKSS
jgi:hypothetical protein